MLYDDQEGDCITPEDVWERLNEDLEVCDLLLWVGISFEQSASVEYFKRVRQQLCSIGRLKQVKQVSCMVCAASTKSQKKVAVDALALAITACWHA